MDAWSGLPIPLEFLKNRSALERQGALVFQVKQCHNCHSLDNHHETTPGASQCVGVLLCHIYPPIIATAASASVSERLTISTRALTLFQVTVVIRRWVDRDRFGIPRSHA